MQETVAPAPVATRDEAPWPFPRRLVALFTSPKALFEHLEQRPSWFVPLLVSLLLVAVFVVVLWNPVLMPKMLLRLETPTGGTLRGSGIRRDSPSALANGSYMPRRLRRRLSVSGVSLRGRPALVIISFRRDMSSGGSRSG